MARQTPGRSRTKRNRRGVPQRRPYPDWTVLSLWLVLPGVDFITIELLAESASKAAKMIGCTLGARHLGGILKALHQLRRRGLIQFKDDTETDSDNSIRLTERGRVVWKALSRIEDCPSSDKREKAEVQAAVLAKFKSLEKLPKQLTVNQLEREVRMMEKLMPQAEEVVIPSNTSSLLTSLRELSGAPSDFDQYVSAPTSPLMGRSSGCQGMQEDQTPVTPNRSGFGPFTRSFYGLPTPPGAQEDRLDVDMDVDEPTSVKNPLCMTPVIQRTGSFNNPLAYPSPISAQRLRYANAEAGPSNYGEDVSESPSKGVQANDSAGILNTVWNRLKRLFKEASHSDTASAPVRQEPKSVEEMVEAIGERFDALQKAASEGNVGMLRLEEEKAKLLTVVAKLREDGEAQNQTIIDLTERLNRFANFFNDTRATFATNAHLVEGLGV